jgi:hypothetical protein
MLGRITTMIAAAMMAASPCAAQMADFEHSTAFRPGASVGAYFRLPLEAYGARRPRAQIGLRLSAIRDHRDRFSPDGPVRQSDAFDLRLSGMSGPSLLIAGRPVLGSRQDRLNLGTGETVALVAGGVGVLLLLAVVAAGPGFPDCQPVGGNSDHCIDD